MDSGSGVLFGWRIWHSWRRVSRDVQSEGGRAATRQHVLQLSTHEMLAIQATVVAADDQVPAMVPRRVVAHVVVDHGLGPAELVVVVEQIEALDQPLAVAPDVVVLRVLLQHGGDEVGLARRGVKSVNDGLPVVPDLVVLEVLQGGRVQPFDLDTEVGMDGAQRLCAVEPGHVCQLVGRADRQARQTGQEPYQTV